MTREEAIKKVLNTALNEVGYLEKETDSDLYDKTKNAGYNNFTKYAKDYFSNLQGESWCAMFVYWCFAKTFGETKAKEILKGKSALCRQIAATLTVNQNPEIGDLIFFQSNGNINHIGIVKDIKNNYIYTIEGNTSAETSVVPNGGRVCGKNYMISNPRIYGYGKPNWNIVATTVSISKPDITPNTPSVAAYRVKGTNVNVRKGPGLSYESLGKVNTGFTFALVGISSASVETWYKLKYNGQDGYIRSDLCEKV